jgi:hypothetical protein
MYFVVALIPDPINIRTDAVPRPSWKYADGITGGCSGLRQMPNESHRVMKSRSNALSSGICLVVMAGAIACFGGLGLAIIRLLAGAAEQSSVTVLPFP